MICLCLRFFLWTQSNWNRYLTALCKPMKLNVH